MLPILILVFYLAFPPIFGAAKWQKKTTKYFMLAVIALMQTTLVLLALYIMKVPKGKYLP
jgi:hypothetical protein